MFEIKRLLESAFVPHDDCIPQYGTRPIEYNRTVIYLVFVYTVHCVQPYLTARGDDFAIQRKIVSATPVYPDLGMKRQIVSFAVDCDTKHTLHIVNAMAVV